MGPPPGSIPARLLQALLSIHAAAPRLIASQPASGGAGAASRRASVAISQSRLFSLAYRLDCSRNSYIVYGVGRWRDATDEERLGGGRAGVARDSSRLSSVTLPQEASY